MASNDVRKGNSQAEFNERMTAFIGTEILLLTALSSYLGYTQFGWNWIATALVTFVLFVILYLTPIFTVVGVFMSLGWGFAAYKFFNWLILATDGTEGMARAIGGIALVVTFIATIGARESGKQYIDDVTEE